MLQKKRTTACSFYRMIRKQSEEIIYKPSSGKCSGNSSGWEGPRIALELPVANGAGARRPDWNELGATVAGSKWDLRTLVNHSDQGGGVSARRSRNGHPFLLSVSMPMGAANGET